MYTLLAPLLCQGAATLNIIFFKFTSTLVNKSKDFKMAVLWQMCLVFDQNDQCYNHFGVI